MRERRGLKRYVMYLMVWVLLGLVFWCEPSIAAQAKSTFEIEATKLSDNGETYNIQLNISNFGEDWEGIVRLTVSEEYREATAYDTVLALPQGSTKQFVVKVPIISMEDTDGTITVSLVNKKQEVVQDKKYNRFLEDDAEVLVMGILSDDYASLTYLDMGGREMYFYGDDYPIKLAEITQDNLAESLDMLDFLVIDTYNTGILTEEELLEIERWNYAGGILLVGTGAYGEQTLAGFQDGYLGVECVKIMEPGNGTDYDDGSFVNLSQLTLTQLHETNMYHSYECNYIGDVWSCAMGDGAVGILPFSLTELAAKGDDFFQYVDKVGYVWQILDIVSGESTLRYNATSQNNYYNYNLLRRILRMLGNVNSPLQFGVLKVIVVLYVIFVGPVLYIILKVLKKKELYWLAVPISSLLGIVLIFFAGRGFEVVDARIYSVTVQDLSEDKLSMSFLYGYDASNKEWKLQLSEGYEYVGPLMNQEYSYSEKMYYHHIQKVGNRLSFGIQPSASFEDSFFCAAKEAESLGNIQSYDISADISAIEGSITNATDKDFAYYLVINNDSMYVLEGLAAGETQHLASEKVLYTSHGNGDMLHMYLYDFLQDIQDEEAVETVSALSALGVGLISAYQEENMGETLIIGVVEDWNKAVDDECREISYGCLYVMQ